MGRQMKHPIDVLKPEYSHLLSVMVVREECRKLVDEVAVKLIGFKSRYEPVTAQNGVPVVFIAASFEREAASDFSKNPAQGWPLNRMSRNVPHNGPFRTWFDAAIAAYHINGLDKVGSVNWTWELICYYGELFNGFGYRDFHHMHSPYLWGGTNIQTVGKYDADGEFNASHMDPQLGIIPVARRMVEIDPTLALPTVGVSAPILSGIVHDLEIGARWIQETINSLGRFPQLDVDDSYGRETMYAVMDFQAGYGLAIDGVAGPETIDAMKKALAA